MENNETNETNEKNVSEKFTIKEEVNEKKSSKLLPKLICLVVVILLVATGVFLYLHFYKLNKVKKINIANALEKAIKYPSFDITFEANGTIDNDIISNEEFAGIFKSSNVKISPKDIKEFQKEFLKNPYIKARIHNVDGKKGGSLDFINNNKSLIKFSFLTDGKKAGFKINDAEEIINNEYVTSIKEMVDGFYNYLNQFKDKLINEKELKLDDTNAIKKVENGVATIEKKDVLISSLANKSLKTKVDLVAKYNYKEEKLQEIKLKIKDSNAVITLRPNGKKVENINLDAKERKDEALVMHMVNSIDKNKNLMGEIQKIQNSKNKEAAKVAAQILQFYNLIKFYISISSTNEYIR